MEWRALDEGAIHAAGPGVRFSALRQGVFLTPSELIRLSTPTGIGGVERVNKRVIADATHVPGAATRAGHRLCEAAGRDAHQVGVRLFMAITSGRLAGARSAPGPISSGHAIRSACDVDSPNELRHCDAVE
jgi:hypothetical protein